MMTALSSNLHFEFAVDLDGKTARQVHLADRRAGMTAVAGAEQFEEKIRCTIDDRRHVGKVWRTIDHAEKAYDAMDPIEIADFMLQGGEDRQCGHASGVLALFQRHVGTELAIGTVRHARMMCAVSR